MLASTATARPRPLLSQPKPNRPTNAPGKALVREYGIALLSLLSAVALRLVLMPWLGTRVPFITLFPAVAVAVWYGGYGPAFATTLLGYLAMDYLIVEPATAISGGPGRLVAFGAYFISCAIIIVFGNGMRRSRSRLQKSEVGLQRQVAALTKLHELSLRLAVTEDLKTALSAILETLVGMHRAKSGLLCLYDAPAGNLGEVASVGFDADRNEALRRMISRLVSGACGRVLASKRRVIVFDTETDPSFAECRDAARVFGFRAIHGTPILTRSGGILGVISLHFAEPQKPDEVDIQFSDLCASHAAEVIEARRQKQALQESEQTLRRQAAELEQQLIASGRLVSVGEITASLAHEFNNPLGVMLGFAQDLRSEKKPEDPDYRPLSIIYEEGKRCQKIVAELLEFARPQPADLKEMRLDDSIEKALSFVRARLYGHKIAVDVTIADDVPSVVADPVRIEQVLVNLFLNAIDAMPNGGSLNVRVDRGADHRQGSVAISVSDTGTGIARESLPRIFHPFFTEKKRTGLGLGLPLCKRIVENHGGSIEAASEIGNGATFTVHLPLNGAVSIH